MDSSNNDYNWITNEMSSRRNDYIAMSSYNVVIRSWNVKTGFCDNDHDLYRLIFNTNTNTNTDTDNTTSTSTNTNTNTKNTTNTNTTSATNSNTTNTNITNTSSKSPIDMIVIGLQEIINLNNPFSSTLDILSLSQTIHWKQKLLNVINSNSNGIKYNVISTVNCVGMCMLLYVRDDICCRISDLRTSITPTGFLGIFGNKGAVSISIVIDDTTMCFVNAHLTSGRENMKRRNNDYHRIINATTFYSNDIDNSLKHYDDNDTNTSSIITSTNLIISSALNIINIPFNIINDSTSSSNSSYYSKRPALRWHLSYDKQASLKRKVSDHEIVFFLGDLNYHIDSSISSDEVFKLVDMKSLEMLEQHDQLLLSKRSTNSDGSIHHHHRHHSSSSGSSSSRNGHNDSNDSNDNNDNNGNNGSSDSNDSNGSNGNGSNGSSSNSGDTDDLKAFTDFQEGRLTFPPTFKCKLHEHDYERKHQPVRAPAWCDRILWKLNPIDSDSSSSSSNVTVDLQNYDSIDILGSDHRPITANFKCYIRGIDSSLEKSIFNGLQYTRHSLDVQNIPKIEIESTVIDLGKLKRLTSITSTIKITNIGNVNANIKASIRDPSHDYHNDNNDPLSDISSFGILCPNPRPKKKDIDSNQSHWFSLSLSTICIEPSESIILEVKSEMDNNIARKLVDSNERVTTSNNDGSSSTKEILCSSIIILMVDGGSHHYITVNGVYRYRRKSDTTNNDSNIKSINDNNNNDNNNDNNNNNNNDDNDYDEITTPDNNKTEFYCGPWIPL